MTFNWNRNAMTQEEVKHLKIDHRYTFRLKDGRELTKRGSWLLGTSKDGHWCIDPRKVKLIETVTAL